jgi:site-specific DNA-adenine methylase
MSGNINDTKINIIKENVDNLIVDLDNILNKGENISDYEYNLKKKYKFLEKTSPALFNLIFKEYNTQNFNKSNLQSILDMMLQQIEKIQKSKVTQHDASISIGEHLAQTFIPQLKK